MILPIGKPCIASITVLLMSCGGCVSGTSLATETGNAHQSLSWLNGCWYSAKTKTQESWAYASDGYYFGHSITRNENGVAFFEQLRITIDHAEGSLFAYPGGDGPYEFPMTQRGVNRIVFSNSNHDYPQRIEYLRDDALLVANISLIDGTRARQWTYEMCAPTEK